MSLHKIAGLFVDMDYKYDRTRTQAAPYLTDEPCEAADMIIKLPDSFVAEQSAVNGLDLNDSEYLCTGAAFNSGILRFGGFMLHSSAVAVDNYAYLFSADSGTGKSTHTGLWLELFGKRARILNDDKPVIRIGKSKIYACGTPWSGKNDISVRENVPIAGICFLERSAENWIKRVPGAAATGKLLKQTIRPPYEDDMNILLSHIDKVLTDVPIYFMGCNISTDAAQMAYEAMRVRTEKDG